VILVETVDSKGALGSSLRRSILAPRITYLAGLAGRLRNVSPVVMNLMEISRGGSGGSEVETNDSR